MTKKIDFGGSFVATSLKENITEISEKDLALVTDLESKISAKSDEKEVTINEQSKETLLVQEVKYAENTTVKEVEKVKVRYQEDCPSGVEYVEKMNVGNADFLGSLAKIIKETPNVISSGIPTFDYVLGGGYPVGICLIAAAPGIGKTTLLLQSASAMSKNSTPVVFISYDMRSLPLTTKVISHQSYNLYNEDCLSISNILNDNALDTEDKGDIYKDKIQNILDKVSDEQKYLIIRDLISDDDFNAFTDKFVELKDLSKLHKIIHLYSMIYKDVVFMIDSLQQLAGQYGSGKEAVDKQLNEIKVLAGQYEVPIILVSTLSRAGYTKAKNLELTDLKESGSAEYDADTVIFLQPTFIKENDDTTNDDFKGLNYRDTTIKCSKSRHSEYREKRMMLYGKGCTFIDVKSEKSSKSCSKSKGKSKSKKDELPSEMGNFS